MAAYMKGRRLRKNHRLQSLLRHPLQASDPPVMDKPVYKGKASGPQLRRGAAWRNRLYGAEKEIPVCGL